MMPSSFSSPESSACGALPSLPALRNHLSTATGALEKTLGTMMALLESQVQELQSLRQSLADVESRLQQTAPQVAALPAAVPSLFAPTVPKPVASLTGALPKMPAGPLMTQILWPSKPSPDAEPTLHQAAPRPAEPVALPGVPADLESDHSTVEALNAALAYAFSQVSNTSPLGAGSITKMIPPPMPTSALRYGTMPEYSR